MNMRFARTGLIATLLLVVILSVTGGTIAWFSDSVTTENNVIKSGNLDVVLEYWDGTSYTEVQTDTKLFSDTALWEPGYTEVVYLKAINAGDLALKYQLGVNVAEENLGKTKSGSDIKLSDYLAFKVVESDKDLQGTFNRDTAKNANAVENDLHDYVGKTKVLKEKNSNAYIALIVYMPENVGNEANHNGTDVPSIKLGVELNAIQYTYEGDSFGSDYDQGASLSTKVTNYDDLKSAIASANDGDVISLVYDIENADGIQIDGKDITIDLNGKTFTVSEGASTNNRVFKITGDSNVTIKNGTLVAKGDISSGAYGTVRTDDSAVVTLNNVKMYSYRGYGLNVKANTGTKITINNSEINAQYGGGVEAAGGTIELNNTTINQKGVYSGAVWCSVAIGVNGNGKAIVNSGSYNAAPIATDSNAAQGTWVAYVMSSGGELEINGGTFNGTVANTAAASNACGVICADRAAVVNINGGTFNSNGAILDMRNNVGTLPNPVATLKGGTFSADPTVSGLYSSNLITLASGLKVEQSNGKYLVIPENATIPAEGIVQVGAKSYEVSSVEGLMNINDILVATSSGEGQSIKVTLKDDVDLAGKVWKPIDKMWVEFDGNGHTISNLTCNAWKAGLFGYLGGGSIKNLTLENVNVTGSQAGAFAGAAEGKIENCVLKGTNTITWAEKHQYDDPNSSLETWSGVGAITGVLQPMTVNATIAEGTTVTIKKTGMTTQAPYVDDLTGYIGNNKGTIINNGTITVVN